MGFWEIDALAKIRDEIRELRGIKGPETPEEMVESYKYTFKSLIAKFVVFGITFIGGIYLMYGVFTIGMKIIIRPLYKLFNVDLSLLLAIFAIYAFVKLAFFLYKRMPQWLFDLIK